MNLRREVASKYLKHYGVRLDPEREVIVCLGSKEGFSHMCLALMGPGDTAIVPAPSFPTHLYAVALAAANAILLEVGRQRAAAGQHRLHLPAPVPQAEAADRQLSRTTRRRPSSSRSSTSRWSSWPSGYGFMVISDLAYADVTSTATRRPASWPRRGRSTWASSSRR